MMMVCGSLTWFVCYCFDFKEYSFSFFSSAGYLVLCYLERMRSSYIGEKMWIIRTNWFSTLQMISNFYKSRRTTFLLYDSTLLLNGHNLFLNSNFNISKDQIPILYIFG